MKFNRKYFCLTVFLILVVMAGDAQEDSAQKAIVKEKAVKMSHAFISGDFETFVQYTYPKIVKAMGGKEEMISFLQVTIQKMAEEGAAFKSVSIGEISNIFQSGKDLHCLVEQNLILLVKGGILKSSAHLLAISENNGKKWFFIDTAPLSTAKLKEMFPDINKDLVLPAKQRPVFTPMDK